MFFFWDATRFTLRLPALKMASRSRSFLALLVILSLSTPLLSSCSLVARSPLLAQQTRINVMTDTRGLMVNESGRVPYQRWRLAPWAEEMRYVWLVGDYDFRKHNSVEIILFFHGMHAKDYYDAFRKELEHLVEKRPDRPFLFVGFVDGPHVLPQTKSAERWKSLSQAGSRPDRLFAAINQVFRCFRQQFPHIRKENTSIVLAGFSGGGRVLNAVGNWLARGIHNDPYAEVFRSRLTKMVYFDCWFEKEVVEIVPTLLEKNPEMKIVATVHMKKPVEHAAILATKYRMKGNKDEKRLVGLNGRLVIYRDDSHWSAMISRLRHAL